jgi:hypothetical protein
MKSVTVFALTDSAISLHTEIQFLIMKNSGIQPDFIVLTLINNKYNNAFLNPCKPLKQNLSCTVILDPGRESVISIETGYGHSEFESR